MKQYIVWMADGRPHIAEYHTGDVEKWPNYIFTPVGNFFFVQLHTNKLPRLEYFNTLTDVKHYYRMIPHAVIYDSNMKVVHDIRDGISSGQSENTGQTAK